MRDAYGIARRNPRIDMMLWFLVRDELRASGWQSGLVSSGGLRKPSFFEFQRLAESVRKHQLAVLRRRPKVDRDTFIRRIVEQSKSADSMRDWIALAPHLGGA
jgi:hypothetical protein